MEFHSYINLPELVLVSIFQRSKTPPVKRLCPECVWPLDLARHGKVPGYTDVHIMVSPLDYRDISNPQK